ncbi:MAG: hypothetical protein ACRDU4_03110 [Mycobacterium sp.]
MRRAEAQTPGEFRASVCRAVARFDRKNATERHQVAYAERKVAHHSRWHVTKQSDGTYDWTSPTGHRYRYRPPELPAPERPSEPADEDLPPF